MYHCISRVVDRSLVFGGDEREKFRIFMRMQENFSSCRVLSYCFMSNYFKVTDKLKYLPYTRASEPFDKRTKADQRPTTPAWCPKGISTIAPQNPPFLPTGL